MLRASGVPYDVRRAYPYFAYPDLDFEIPVGENGDNFDRYLVRMEEMEQSMRNCGTSSGQTSRRGGECG
jgi:NADH-quinone oxidoreductase subunit D